MSQTVVYSTTHPPETNLGIVTSYLPVTSFPAVSGCSAEIYSDVLFVAFNPFYGQDILKTVTCHPQAVTLWWQQSTPQTTTELGPIVCPDLYTTASTSIVNSYTTFVACCPKDYTFNKRVPVSNVGECNSPLSKGQTVSFMTYVSSSWVPGTTTITAPGSSVSGVHINGFVFAPSTSSTGTSTTSIIGGHALPTSVNEPPEITSSTSSPAPTSSPLNVVSSTSGLTTGVKIGIGIGVPLAALGICSLIIAIILIRRSNKAKPRQESFPEERSALKPELDMTQIFPRQPVATPVRTIKSEGILWEGMSSRQYGTYELGVGQRNDVYEMGATIRSPIYDERSAT